MRSRDAAALDSSSEDLGVDAVGFATMLPDTNLTGSGRIDEQHLIAPFTQNVVHVPGLTARFDRYFRRLRLRTELRLERVDGTDRQTPENLTTGHLTECDLPYSEIEGYVSHG